MSEVEYRVCYRKPDGPPRVWAQAETLERAEGLAHVAELEGRWGEVWIESHQVTPWERVQP